MNGSSETAQSEAVKKLNEHRLFVMPLEVERARAWLDVLGSHALPVTSREPVVPTEGPFKGKRFYMMAYPELLTSVDKERLMAYVERTFGLSRAEAERDFDKYGVPLLADHLVMFEGESHPHRQNPEQFALETTEEDLKAWLAKDLARAERLRPQAYKGDSVATAEYEMVQATANQLSAELRYLAEVKQRELETSANMPGEAGEQPA